MRAREALVTETAAWATKRRASTTAKGALVTERRACATRTAASGTRAPSATARGVPVAEPSAWMTKRSASTAKRQDPAMDLAGQATARRLLPAALQRGRAEDKGRAE